jgi:hypothetical protein
MMSTDSHSPSEIQEILRLKNIAVVGMSNTDGKPANLVPKYLGNYDFSRSDNVWNNILCCLIISKNTLPSQKTW